MREAIKNDSGSWQLLIKCVDGLWESQGYAIYSEAVQAGDKQLKNDDVVDYKIKRLSLP